MIELFTRLALRFTPPAPTEGATNPNSFSPVRGWWSLSFLYPGLHLDGFGSRGSGWPKHFTPFAAEAWRRFEAGELTDNELYCYQAAKARIGKERDEVMRTTPWLMTDHFAA